jgi:hypothetical protein
MPIAMKVFMLIIAQKCSKSSIITTFQLSEISLPQRLLLGQERKSRHLPSIQAFGQGHQG